jgi:2-polyprenyl-6-hydroxyphenyl methylase/3-demethylubiquinone-9 3-methyltransferase
MSDLQIVEPLLRNESDVAYKRRVRTMLQFLDPAPGDRILDCGCGMGFYLRALCRLATGTFAGVDGDPQALGFARQALDGLGVGLLRGDVLHLPYGDGAFDKVLFSEVLEHLPDDRQGLAEIRRVLRPGGTLALTVPQKDYPFLYDPINRVAEGLFRHPIRRGPFAGIWANHYRLYRPEEVVARVHGAGFEVLEVRNLTHFCFPFTQTIVYTFGKGAIERGLLPDFLLRSTHRFRSEDNKGSPWNPVNWVLALFDAVDRLNAHDDGGKRAYVNVAIKARRRA